MRIYNRRPLSNINYSSTDTKYKNHWIQMRIYNRLQLSNINYSSVNTKYKNHRIQTRIYNRRPLSNINYSSVNTKYKKSPDTNAHIQPPTIIQYYSSMYTKYEITKYKCVYTKY